MEEEQKTLITNDSAIVGRQFQSCCFRVDASFCRFAVCFIVSLCTLLAGLLKLVTEPGCDTYSFWGPLVTLIIGIWTPTPKKGDTQK